MTAVRRVHAGAPAPVVEGARAKALRVGVRDLRAETRAALHAFEGAASDWESMRASGRDDASLALDDRFLRNAAAIAVDALVRELRDGRATLPPDLVADVERWLDGEFAGSDADVEVANHAIHALLGSDVLAEIDRAAE